MSELGFTKFIDLPVGDTYDNSELPVDVPNLERKTGGILRRNVAHTDQTVRTIGADAARSLFETMGIGPKDCGGLVLTTTTELQKENKAASKAAEGIAHDLGIQGEAYGINYACSSFPKSVQEGIRIAEGTDKHVLLIAAETLSRYLNWKEPDTAVLFGDRGAATTISPEGPHKILDAWAEEFEDPDNLIHLTTTNDWNDIRGQNHRHRRYSVTMNGGGLFRIAPDSMVDSVQRTLDNLHMSWDTFVFFQHQANGRFADRIPKVMKKRGLPKAKIVSSMEFGNTAACSIPSALARHLDEKEIVEGLEKDIYPDESVIVTPAVGAGPDVQQGKLTRGNVMFVKNGMSS